MKNNVLKVGVVQQSCCEDKASNISKSIAMIRACVEDGAQLVVLQELHCDIYFCQSEEVDLFEWAETLPGASYEQFAAVAAALDIVLVTSLFEKRAEGVYHNTAVVFERDGSEAGRYRKMHIPDDPAYYEKFYFSPGDMGFTPISTSLGKLGVLVCWDQWFPEAARLMAMAGAELLIYPTAIGFETSDAPQEKERQREAWMLSQRAHAVANGIPVVAVNRVGHEADWTKATGGIEFWGSSFVAGPQGEILWQGSLSEEMHQVIEIDRQRSKDVRRIWPFFRDRRIDAYQDLLKRYID